MPLPPPLVSVVIPVRNAEHRIAVEIQRVLEALGDLTRQRCEVIVVDDGSSDMTTEVLSETASRFPQVQVLRHSQPRGIEAAGQSGLEQASGELVFVQEDNRPIRLEDMRRLFRLSEDPSIVAARAASTPRPPSNALLRRLQPWGTHPVKTLRQEPARPETTGLQMIRRPHLPHLGGPTTAGVNFRSDVFDLTSVVSQTQS